MYMALSRERDREVPEEEKREDEEKLGVEGLLL